MANQTTRLTAERIREFRLQMLERTGGAAMNVYGVNMDELCAITQAAFTERAQAEAAERRLADAERAHQITLGRLQEVIDKSEPRMPGGQQVGTQRYQATPSTRQELQRIVKHAGLRS